MSNEVKVGQLWKSTDRRDRGEKERILEVLDIEMDFARVKNTKTGKTTRILLSRLKPGSTGYELVKDPHAQEQKTEAA